MIMNIIITLIMLKSSISFAFWPEEDRNKPINMSKEYTIDRGNGNLDPKVWNYYITNINNHCWFEPNDLKLDDIEFFDNKELKGVAFAAFKDNKAFVGKEQRCKLTHYETSASIGERHGIDLSALDNCSVIKKMKRLHGEFYFNKVSVSGFVPFLSEEDVWLYNTAENSEPIVKDTKEERAYLEKYGFDNFTLKSLQKEKLTKSKGSVSFCRDFSTYRNIMKVYQLHENDVLETIVDGKKAYFKKGKDPKRLMPNNHHVMKRFLGENIYKQMFTKFKKDIEDKKDIYELHKHCVEVLRSRDSESLCNRELNGFFKDIKGLDKDKGRAQVKIHHDLNFSFIKEQLLSYFSENKSKMSFFVDRRFFHRPVCDESISMGFTNKIITIGKLKFYNFKRCETFGDIQFVTSVENNVEKIISPVELTRRYGSYKTTFGEGNMIQLGLCQILKDRKIAPDKFNKKLNCHDIFESAKYEKDRGSSEYFGVFSSKSKNYDKDFFKNNIKDFPIAHEFVLEFEKYIDVLEKKENVDNEMFNIKYFEDIITDFYDKDSKFYY